MIFKNRRRDARVRELLRESIVLVSQMKQMPEQSCPYVRDLHLLLSIERQHLAILMLDPPVKDREVLMDTLRSVRRAVTECEKHVVRDHIEEGGLADLLPDRLEDMPGWRD